MKTFTHILFFSLIIAFNFALSQKQIQFRDGNSYSIQGKLMGSVQRIQNGENFKKEEYYYLRTGNKITISIYSIWNDGKMDGLKVYQFETTQLNSYGMSEVEEFEIDEYYKNIRYNVSFHAESETPFVYNEFSSWSNEAKQRSFTVFSISSEEKNMMEFVYNDIKPLLVTEAETEED
jgi:hypothetical protein